MIGLYRYIALPIALLIMIGIFPTSEGVLFSLIGYVILQIALNHFEAKNIKFDASK
jgi:uncharacterized membrane protein